MGNLWKKISDCGGIKNILLGYYDYKYTCRTKKLIIENKQEILPEIHAAIIIALTGEWERDIQTFTHGIDLLINYFKTNKILFNVYECKTPDEAKKIIEKNEVNKIWIFGHGRIDALDFGKKNNSLEYSVFKNFPEEQKKDFIGQFHCNTNADLHSSLAAYILKPNGKKFIKKGYRCSHKNRLAIECCNKHNWSCEDICE
jgi:hypothetical protein